MKRGNLGVLLTICLLACLFALPSYGAGFDLSGEKVNIVVPFKEGGGTDTYARLFAPFLEKYLPGHPTILVRNEPGGGSVKAANKFHNRTKADGLTLFAVSSSTYTNFVIGGPKIKFDMLAWNPIILSPIGTVYYAAATTGVKGKSQIADVKTLQDTPVKYGANNPTSVQLGNIIGFELLGMKKLKVVFGLSTGEKRQAVIRGELNLGADTINTYIKSTKPFVDKGQLVPLFTMGYGSADGKIIRDPNYPDMQTISELYEKLYGKAISGPEAAAFENFVHMNVTAAKSIVLPKDTPQEIIDTYVKAVKKVIQDPEFRKKAASFVGVYPQYYGKDAKKIMRLATDMKPETKVWLKKWIKDRFDVNI